jgi:2,4-dienoyl-CoA reductase (NADPH2)
LPAAGVDVRLNTAASADELAKDGFDHVIVATGVTPRALTVDGADGPNVITYIDALTDAKPVGQRVAIIGAGGIGFDVAEYLTSPHSSPVSIDNFLAHWGIDPAHKSAGGMGAPVRPATERSVVMLQRTDARPGKTLGLTTGWVVRAELKSRGVQNITGATYTKIDEKGLHILIGNEEKLIEADTIVVCAGQEPENSLHDQLKGLNISTTLIGGAEKSAGLDALRAIRQGTETALAL